VVVTVAPITHTPPAADEAANAFPLPAATKARLGLDSLPSWIIASDLNQFVWPGVDLRPMRKGGDEAAYGFLPANLVGAVRDRIVELAKGGARLMTKRSGATP
jgi:hypothetical protein